MIKWIWILWGANSERLASEFQVPYVFWNNGEIFSTIDLSIFFYFFHDWWILGYSFMVKWWFYHKNTESAAKPCRDESTTGDKNSWYQNQKVDCQNWRAVTKNIFHHCISTGEPQDVIKTDKPSLPSVLFPPHNTSPPTLPAQLFFIDKKTVLRCIVLAVKKVWWQPTQRLQ